MPVPAGGFWMGQDGTDADANIDEVPTHWVEVAAFYIDKYEVTNAEYAEFLNAAGRIADPQGRPYIDAADPHIRIHFNSGQWQADPGWEDHPMREVSWYGADAYCRWKGGRLPTEAEWEKAARWHVLTGHSRKWPWGDEFDCALNSSWWCNEPYTTGITTLPVGSFPGGASPYGVMDMAGNVWEWTAGGYRGYSGGPLGSFVDPTREVVKGGSWTNSDYNLRSAVRSPVPRYITDANIGFRVCYSVVPPPAEPVIVPPRETRAIWREEFTVETPMDEIHEWWGTGRSFTIDAANGWLIASLEHPTTVAGEYMAMIRRDTGGLFAPGDYVDITVRLRYERGDRDFARTSVGVAWGDETGIIPGGRGADENFGWPWFLIANNSDAPGVWHEVTARRLVWGEGALCIGFGLWGNLSQKADPPIIGQHRMWVDWVQVEHSACTSGPADLDGDCDVDMSDFGQLQSCFTEAGALVAPPCRNADLDGDSQVNQHDLELFRACLSGAINGLLPGCANLSDPG